MRARGRDRRRGEIGLGNEERAGERIEDGRVDEAGVRRQVVAGDCEVGGGVDYGVGKVAQAGWPQRTGSRAQHQDGARLVSPASW
jgi:hypothetical protein